MPRPLDIDREAVKTLAIAVGIREAARQTNIPEATVQAWSARGHWLQHTKPTQPLPASIRPTTVATKPSQAMVNCLDRKKLKTKWNLACYTENASKVAAKSRAPLAIAQDVRHVAAVMSHVWPEQHQSGLSLQILNVNGGMS